MALPTRTDPLTNALDADRHALHGVPSAELLKAVADLMLTVYDRTGVDFRDYAPTSLARRVQRRLLEEHLDDVADLQRLACSDRACMQRLLNSLTLPVTTMFRDPSFFRILRAQLCPVLATYPYLRFWVAGCSTGQEAYSLAIVLHEAGLLDRSIVYATDLHAGLIEQAQAAVYPLSVMQEYTQNYHLGGGVRAFTDYYYADSEHAALLPQLRQNIVFASHNLVCDSSFNEFHVVLCRNVMLYFNERLQERVQRLLYQSLITLGYLGLGRSETIRFTYHEADYDTVSKTERLYRKIR
jgi:chemotaxis protein methyltransferase CheR